MNCQQKINKIAHYCNFSRFFFQTMRERSYSCSCFKFQLNLFQILGPRNHVFSFICSTKQYIQCHLRFSVIVIQKKHKYVISIEWYYSFPVFQYSIGSTWFYSAFNRKPVYFPEIGWSYKIARRDYKENYNFV